MVWKWPLLRLMATIASVRSLLMSFLFGIVSQINKHLNAPNQQTSKTPAFIKDFTPSDDQLIKDM